MRPRLGLKGTKMTEGTGTEVRESTGTEVRERTGSNGGTKRL
jgi:hypothetical protein